MRRIMEIRQRTVSLASTASKPDLKQFRSRKVSSHISPKKSEGDINLNIQKIEPSKKSSHQSIKSLKNNQQTNLKLNYQGIPAICLRPNRILSLHQEKKI